MSFPATSTSSIRADATTRSSAALPSNPGTELGTCGGVAVSLTNSRRLLPGAARQLGDAIVDVPLRGLDAVLARERIEREHGAHLPFGAQTILAAELFQPLRVGFELGTALARARQEILDERIHLPIDERFRYFERVAPHELLDQLLAHLFIRLATQGLLEPPAKLAAEILERRAFAVFLGELVVCGRKDLLADAAQHELEAHHLAGDGGIRVLLGKVDLDELLLADLRADERSLDLDGHRSLTELDQAVLALAVRKRLAVDRGRVVDRHEVTFPRLVATLDRTQLGERLAKMVDRAIDVALRDHATGALGGQTTRVGDLDLREHVDGRAVAQGLSRLDALRDDLRRTDRSEARLFDRVRIGVLDHVREHVGADLVAEQSLEHGTRRAARPEALELGLPLYAAEGALELRGDVVDRHLDRELPPRRVHFLDRHLHASRSASILANVDHGRVVREGGLEPPSLAGPDPKSGASASSATLALGLRRSFDRI